jgi:hypothetical protein
VLTASGLGWSDDERIAAMLPAIATGAATYAAVLLGSWILAGRPAGGEADVLALLRRVTR